MKSVNELANNYWNENKDYHDSDGVDVAQVFTDGFNAAIEQLSQGSGEFEQAWVFEAENDVYDVRGYEIKVGEQEVVENDYGETFSFTPTEVTHMIDISALASVQAKLLKAEQENERLRGGMKDIKQLLITILNADQNCDCGADTGSGSQVDECYFHEILGITNKALKGESK